MSRNGSGRSWLAFQKRRRTLTVPAQGGEENAILTEDNIPISSEDGQELLLESGG
jgi:hypothetical protein